MHLAAPVAFGNQTLVSPLHRFGLVTVRLFRCNNCLLLTILVLCVNEYFAVCVIASTLIRIKNVSVFLQTYNTDTFLNASRINCPKQVHITHPRPEKNSKKLVDGADVYLQQNYGKLILKSEILS